MECKKILIKLLKDKHMSKLQNEIRLFRGQIKKNVFFLKNLNLKDVELLKKF